MALTQDESAALMADQQFKGRVKVCCLKYADSIINEASTVAGHVARYNWARNTFIQPDQVAGQVQPPTVMDGQVQTDGAAITDAALQTSVEATVNKMI